MSQLEYNIIDGEIPTFVTLPLDTLDGGSIENPEAIRIIGNAVIHKLPDGLFEIVEVDEVNQNFEICSLSAIEKPSDLVEDNAHKTEITPQPYKCLKCQQEFTKISSYRRHLLEHRNVKKYKCDKCSASYNVETNLKIHTAMHLEGKPTCPVCGILFQRLASLKSHVMVHQVEELFTCEECSAEFEKEDDLTKHLQNHLNKTSYDTKNLICGYCNVKLDDSKSYKEHISHHNKVKKMVVSGKKSRKTNLQKDYPNVCSYCPKSFSRISLLERHLRIHTGEKPFRCEYCDKAFNQKGTLQIHLAAKHTGLKRFHCTLCSARFSQKGNLRVHVEKTHTAPMPGIKTYKCSHCTCIFKKISSLNVHITKAHGTVEEDLSITDVIDKLKVLEGHMSNMTENDRELVHQNPQILNKLKTVDADSRYVRLAESFLDGTVKKYLVLQKTVNDVRLYICNFCNKEFKKPSDLIRHTRVHTREKPFLCKQCGLSFSLKSTLFSHFKTHVKNNYICGICLREFITSRTFHAHLKKHNLKQNQPFKCNMCNKWFKSFQKANIHYVNVHNKGSNMEFRCHICNTVFTKLVSFNKHMSIHNEGKKFKCETCGKSYNNKHALSEHKKIHSGVKNFECRICSKKFVNSYQLKRHVLTHSTEKFSFCPHCFESFDNAEHLQKHLKTHNEGITGDEALPEGKIAESAAPDALKPVTVDELVRNLDEPFYEIVPNTTDKTEPVSANQLQTIYINCEDLQLTDTNVYSQIKLENTETLLFNSLTENQENNVFNLALSEVQNSELFNPQIFVTNESDSTKPSKNPMASTSKEPNNTSYFLQNSDLNLFFNLDLEPPQADLTLAPINSLEENNITEEIKEKETSPQKTWSCDKCEKSFTVKNLYMKHLKVHQVNKPAKVLHTCTFCTKGFKKLSDLTRHTRTHTGEKPFPCDKCEKKFSLKSTLLSHQRTHNPISHKQYNCVVCNSFFTSKSSLKVHTSVHTGDKAYTCSFCPMTFRTAGHKKSHETNQHVQAPKRKIKSKVTNLLEAVALGALNSETIETDDQLMGRELDNILVVPEPLSIMGEPAVEAEPMIMQQLHPSLLIQDHFLSSSLIQLDDGTLLNVKATFNENLSAVNQLELEKPPRNLECDVCHKMYASKDVLRKHKKIHMVKEFACSKCEKSFDRSDELETHEKIHDGDRPYSCEYCNNSFAKINNLATHMKRIHDISLKDNLLLYDIK